MVNVKLPMHHGAKPRQSDSAASGSREIPNIRFRGFTLIEILVVIAIIAVLLGIGLLVGPEVLGTGNKQITNALLNNCLAISADYETRVGQPVNNFGTMPINWGNPSKRSPNVPNSTQPDVSLSINKTNDSAGLQAKSIEQFVYATYKIDAIKTKLYSSAAFQMGSTSLLGDSDGNGMLDIVDGWNTKIIYVAPNIDTSFKVPVRSFPYFASPGPDGKWGTWDTNTDQPNDDGAADNIYSFDAH